MIYTVFTLSSPDDELDVRFIGYTTQTTTKRLSDILAVARNETCNGHDSVLSKWLRKLLAKNQLPAVNVILHTFDRDEAVACRTSTFNCFVPLGRLLHTTRFKGEGTRLQLTMGGGAPGRKTKIGCKNYTKGLEAKQRRGEVPFSG